MPALVRSVGSLAVPGAAAPCCCRVRPAHARVASPSGRAHKHTATLFQRSYHAVAHIDEKENFHIIRCGVQ
eukprot:1797699-Pleurochrysis_carterae.AAC.1